MSPRAIWFEWVVTTTPHLYYWAFGVALGRAVCPDGCHGWGQT